MFNNHNLDHAESRPLIEYWHVIRRHKWSIISVTLLCTIIGVLIASSIKPAYMSTSRILVEPDNRKLLSVPNPLESSINIKSFYRAQVELIRSRTLAIEVIEKLRMNSHADFLPEKPNIFQSFFSTNEKGMPAESKRQGLTKTKDLVSNFNSRLEVELEKNSDIVRINYESGDPVFAAKVANAVSQVYIDRVKLSQNESNKETMGWLSENLELARKKLVESEAELQSYQSQAQIGDSDEEAKIRSGKLGSITAELLAARTTRAVAEIRFKQINNIPRSIESYKNLEYVIKSKQVRFASEKMLAAKHKLGDLQERYGNKHPKIISAKAEVKFLEKQYHAEIFRAVDSEKNAYELAVATENEVGRIYDQLQSESLKNKGTRFDLAKLEREVETNRDIYDLLLTRMKETDITQSGGKINIKVLDRAQVPAAPFKPNRLRIIGIAFMLGLLLSLIVAFSWEFNDKTFKTAENVIEITKLPLLGIFPIIPKKDLIQSSPERLIVDKPRSSIAESINNIRTNLLFSNEDDNQVIMVTSAVASEGKTTVSCNIGVSLASLGPTLVIEADTRRPRMRAIVAKNGIKGGVFEYISGRATLSDSVASDPKIKNLYTLPVNVKPAKPIEFLSSRRFADALLVLRKKFKYIVIDTPPVLPVSDAIVLSPIVDGIVMVVCAESTKHAMTKDALNRLSHVNSTMVGAVLTRANPKTFGSYGSNYYYGYGYGYSAY